MNWRENMSRSKEVLGAYLRQGAHELAAMLYGPGTAAQHPELGMLATRTPSQIADGLRGGRDATVSRDDTAPSILDQHLQQAKDRTAPEREPEREDRQMERD